MGDEMNLWKEDGENLASETLSEEVHEQATEEEVYGQFLDEANEYHHGQGETMSYTKISRITKRGKSHDEDEPSQKASYKLANGSFKVTEYLNTIDIPRKTMILSQHDLPPAIRKILKKDYLEVMEGSRYARFAEARFKAVLTGPTRTDISFSTNGNVTPGTISASITLATFRRCSSFLKKKLVPKKGSYFISIGSIDFNEALYDDLEEVTKYTEPGQRLTSEIGKIYDTRCVEDNFHLANDLGGADSGRGEAFMFGDEAVVEGFAQGLEITAKRQGSAGRILEISWYCLGGNAKMWDVIFDEKREPDAPGYQLGFERILHINPPQAA